MIEFKKVVLIVLAGLLPGCVNLEAVGKFADGAEKLSEASAEFYQAELQTDRKLAGLTVDLAEPANNNESAWVKASKGENLMAEARRNKAAVAALANYADGLKSIAFFDNDEAVAKSAEKLSGNLSGLASELDRNASPDESALAEAITQLASLYTRVKTQEIIHDKVKAADPYVEVIVKTMIGDIERQQSRFAITRLNANVNREKWFNAFKKDYQSGNLSASQKSFAAMAAGQLVEDELQEKLAERSTRQFLTQLKKTANSCLSAHKAIRDTDLQSDAKALSEFADDARKLYRNLDSIR